NIFVFEEIVSSKLHAIEIAVYVEEERITAPTEEKMEVADLRHQGFLSDGHRCLLDDNFTFLTHTTCSHALKTAHCRSLLPVSRRRELHAPTEIGNCIIVCVDLEFVERSRFKWLARCRLR